MSIIIIPYDHNLCMQLLAMDAYQNKSKCVASIFLNISNHHFIGCGIGLQNINVITT